jgi:uncharacterized protein (DUF934 family)
MPMLIRNGQNVVNDWQLISIDAGLDKVEGTDTMSNVIVPLAMWLTEKEKLTRSGRTIGVWLDSEDDPYSVANDIATLPLIALKFPSFRDGRAYSSAAILRSRLHFTGELRAIGDVLRDQLYYMQKCGFDSFDLSDGVKTEDAMSAFSDFHTGYQSTVTEPTPLFRRR